MVGGAQATGNMEARWITVTTSCDFGADCLLRLRLRGCGDCAVDCVALKWLAAAACLAASQHDHIVPAPCCRCPPVHSPLGHPTSPHASCVQVKLPLDVGTRVSCKWRDHQYHTVRIIERRPAAAASRPDLYDYYVHYIGCECGQMHEPCSIKQV